MSQLDDPRLARLAWEVRRALACDETMDGALELVECFVALLRDKRRLAIEELVSATRVPDDASEL